MVNKYNNPILGSVNIDTQAYYGALAKSKIAQDALSSTVGANPFTQEAIDADKVGAQNALRPFNNELTSLVDSYTSSNDPRSFSKGIIDIQNKYNNSKTNGSLTPYSERYKQYNETIKFYGDLEKQAKSNTEKNHIQAQKELFKKSQTAYTDNTDLNYLTNTQGVNSNYYEKVDPLVLADKLATRVKEDKIDLGVTTHPLAGNIYYEAMVGKHKVYVDKDKLGSSILDGFKTKKEEFARMYALGDKNLGVDEKGNFEGPSDEYAVNTATGKINRNTRIGAGINSSITAYTTDNTTASRQLLKTGVEFPKTPNGGGGGPVTTPEDKRLQLYETQYNVKIREKGNENWEEANKGIYTIKKKLEKNNGDLSKLEPTEVAKLSSYNRAKQQKEIYTKEFENKHPEKLQLEQQLTTELSNQYPDINPDVFTKYTNSDAHDGVSKTIRNREFASDIFESILGDELSPETLKIIKGEINNPENKLFEDGESISNSNFATTIASAVSGKIKNEKERLLVGSLRHIGSNNTVSLLSGSPLTDKVNRFIDVTEATIDEEYLANNKQVRNSIANLKALDKEYTKGLNEELKKTDIANGVAITPEALGKSVWDKVSESIVPHFTGTDLAKNLGKTVYKLDNTTGHLTQVEVDDVVKQQFAQGNNMKINKIIDYNFRAPDYEIQFTTGTANDKVTHTYTVPVPKSLQAKTRQFYKNSTTTPTQKRVGVKGAVSRIKDLDTDFRWNHIKVDYNQNKNILSSILNTGSSLNEGAFGADTDINNLKDVNIYREQISSNKSGVKMKTVTKDGTSKVYNTDDLISYFTDVFATRDKPDGDKKAIVYNIIETHLKKNNKDKDAEEILRKLAEDPEVSYEDFIMEVGVRGKETKSDGFIFPNKQTALGLISNVPLSQGPLRGYNEGK